MFFKLNYITVLLFLFLLLDFVRMIIPGGYVLYENGVIIISIIAIIILILSYKRFKKLKYSSFYILVVLFCLLIVSFDIYQSGFVKVVILSEHICWIFLPLLCVLNSQSKKELFIVANLFILLNLFIAIPSVVNQFIDLPGLTNPGNIFIDDGGYYGNRNVNAMINIMSLVISLFLMINKSNKLRYICFVSLLFNLLCVLFSGSRTSIICLVIIVFIYALNYIKNKKILLFSVTFTLGISVFVIFYRFIGENYTIEGIESFLNHISSNRYYIWKEALIISKDNLLFGSGMNTLSDNCMRYFGESSALAIYYGTLNNCHNLFINILYNSGVIALLYFIGLCVYYLKIIFENPINLKRLSTLMVVLCGFLISMLDIPLLYTTSVINIIWWLFVFYSVSEA